MNTKYTFQLLAVLGIALTLLVTGCKEEAIPQLPPQNGNHTPAPDPDPEAVLDANPSTGLAYGIVQINASKQKTFTVRNVSPSKATNIRITSSDSNYVLDASDCPQVLHPGTSCLVKVNASPSAVGNAPEASITVLYDNGFGDKSFTVALTSRGSNSGAFDSTFGASGKIRGLTNILNHYERIVLARAAIVGTEEKIYVAGSGDTALMRLNMDGTSDINFDADGIAQHAMGGETMAMFVELDNPTITTDGRILRLVKPGTGFYVTRHSIDGTKDLSFNPSATGAPKGVVAITGVDPSNFNSGHINLRQLFVHPVTNTTNKIVVLAKETGTGNAAKLVKMDGPDGANQTVESIPGLQNAGHALDSVLQSDKKLVIKGQEPVNGILMGSTVLIRLNQDLTPDTSFNVTGSLTLPRCGYGTYSAMGIRGTGDARRIYVVRPGCIVSIKMDGTLDVTTNIGIDLNVRSVAMMSNGKIVYIGTRQVDPQKSVFYLTRRNLNGSKDTAFGTDGLLEIAYDSSHPKSSVGLSVAFQADSKIIVVGNSEGIFSAADSDSGIGRAFGCLARLLP